MNKFNEIFNYIINSGLQKQQTVIMFLIISFGFYSIFKIRKCFDPYFSILLVLLIFGIYRLFKVESSNLFLLIILIIAFILIQLFILIIVSHQKFDDLQNYIYIFFLVISFLIFNNLLSHYFQFNIWLSSLIIGCGLYMLFYRIWGNVNENKLFQQNIIKFKLYDNIYIFTPLSISVMPFIFLNESNIKIFKIIIFNFKDTKIFMLNFYCIILIFLTLCIVKVFLFEEIENNFIKLTNFIIITFPMLLFSLLTLAINILNHKTLNYFFTYHHFFVLILFYFISLLICNIFSITYNIICHLINKTISFITSGESTTDGTTSARITVIWTIIATIFGAIWTILIAFK